MPTSQELTVYTLGHGSRSWESFLDILHVNGIGCVVDVRSAPGSHRHPQFSRAIMETELRRADINYDWQGAVLGGFRKSNATSPHTALDTQGLRAYADHMETAAFHAGIEQLLVHARRVPTAMLCAETLAQSCHRYLISDYLTHLGIGVVHIITQENRVPHRMSVKVRDDAGRLIYDLVPASYRQLGLNIS